MKPSIVRAAELERMTPAERHASFEQSIVWDLADAPSAIVDRSRARLLERVEPTPPTDL